MNFSEKYFYFGKQTFDFNFGTFGSNMYIAFITDGAEGQTKFEWDANCIKLLKVSQDIKKLIFSFSSIVCIFNRKV